MKPLYTLGEYWFDLWKCKQPPRSITPFYKLGRVACAHGLHFQLNDPTVGCFTLQTGNRRQKIPPGEYFVQYKMRRCNGYNVPSLFLSLARVVGLALGPPWCPNTNETKFKESPTPAKAEPIETEPWPGSPAFIDRCVWIDVGLIFIDLESMDVHILVLLN